MYRIKFKNNLLTDMDGLSIEKYDENKYKVSGLKNGSYNVRIYAGDENDEGDINLYSIINQVRQMPIWVTDRAIVYKDYETKVEDGNIDFDFSGRYVCIQGIDISEKIYTIPQNVRAQSTGSSVTITFNVDEGQSKYYIYKNREGADTDPIRLEAQASGYVDTEVILGEKYTYQVCAVDALGFKGKLSNPATAEVCDEKITSMQVRNLVAETISDSETKLTWREPDIIIPALEKKGLLKLIMGKLSGRQEREKQELIEASSPVLYKIYRKTPICNYKYIGQVKAGEKLEFVDNTLVTDRVYTYGVKALNRGGYSQITEVDSTVVAPMRKRQMESLDRGAVAIKTKDGMFIAFRLNGWEYMENAGFNIYADGVKINPKPITGATNYLHREGSIDTEYIIKIIVDNTEEETGYKARNLGHNYFDIPIKKPDDYTTPDGHTYSYTANDASVADLDGDGEYEIILKWDCNGKDNSHKGYSGIVYIDAYKLDGTMLWRIDLGRNIRCGAHYTQFMVYDFDGDGYGEMIVKTADGTMDYQGNVVGDKNADYRNEEGFIIDGPEYLSLIDGRTGAIIDTVPYDPPRGNVSDWGDSWGNRVDRFLACVAYLDGVHPSAVMCRGYYDHGRPTHLAAYDVKDKRLVKRWKFQADFRQNINYTNQGFHNLAVADVDGDGCDEIVYGACVIDHDGTGLYSTGLEHGDAMHLGRFKKDSEGFDYFGIHEHADCPYGFETREAGTGKITFGEFTGRDTGRGLCAKIDPRHQGNQFWIQDGDGIYNYATGEKISDTSPESINFAIWWDGDLLRELLDHDWYGYETNVGIPKIYKWNWKEEELEIIMSTDKVLSNNGTKGNPCIQASILGDWREDIIFRGKDSTFLRLYTTTDLTEHRFYTFMHDPVYRLGIAWQNTAYNQPPHTSFYIGSDMEWIPVPDYTYIPNKNQRV